MSEVGHGGSEKLMQVHFERFSKGIYCVISLALMLLAFILVVGSLWNLLTGTLTGAMSTARILHIIGLVIVSVAIFDVGNYLMEEEVLRNRELRSMRQARSALTKLMTIIIVATTLESLVIVFETKQQRISDLLYPSVLLVSAVLALVGLGAFQWLSSSADALRPWESAAAEAEAQGECGTLPEA